MDEGKAAARAAGLRYVKPGEPGFTRQKRGKGFVVLEASGKRVTDDEALARIRHLAIPPAWQNVWICRDSDGHLQATGLDVRGRKQYRYHADWAERRNLTKFHRMIAFAEALPGMRRRIRDDLSRHGLPRERVVACVVELMEKTLIRVGNSEYAKTNKSYGLTTVTSDHVSVTGNTVRFKFRGKSGKDHDIATHDPKAARIVRKCQELGGHELFAYVDEAGAMHDISSSDVNLYLTTACCGEFTAKDFRTWGGTVFAFEKLRALEPPRSERDGKRQVLEVIRATAQHLGNTPAMSRKYYIHPAVLAAYMDGTIHASLPKHPHPAEMSAAEADLLAFLKAAPAHTATKAVRQPSLKRQLQRSVRASAKTLRTKRKVA